MFAHTLTEAGVSVQLLTIEGVDHIFLGHDDIDGVVRLSVEYSRAGPDDMLRPEANA